MDTHYDYYDQEDDCYYAEEYEFVLADPGHHGLDQLATFAEVVAHRS